MRVAVAGCGYWGSRHLRVMQQLADVDVVCAVDASEERRTALRRAFPAVSSFGDLSSALPYVDAVVVATPPTSHESMSLQAIRAGKHVLVEKPMTTSTAGGRLLIDEARAAGVILMVGHTFEYNAAVQKLQAVVASGELGTIYYIDTARLNLGIYQSDVNVLWDLAPHDVSIVNAILGGAPSLVQAWGASHAHAYLEDVAQLRLHYADLDITAHIDVSWLNPCKVRRVTVVGSKKMAVYNDLIEQEPIRIYDKGVVRREDEDEFHNLPMSYRYGDIVAPYVMLQEPLMREDQHFIDCIRDGRRPLTDGENGLAVVRVLEAAALSLEEGAAVSLTEGWRSELLRHGGSRRLAGA